jgi:outer membrane receptor protein involved in Fe transport
VTASRPAAAAPAVRTTIALLGLLPGAYGFGQTAPATDPAPRELAPVVVTATGRADPLSELAGNTARIDGQAIRLTGHTHISELASRAPGTWVVRGSGQEHLTAIRSPVLTGAGACGAFLYLEDGVPIRPAGFCNVNELFEINSEQASAVEVVRGPGNALYGSNALHGIINVIPPRPDELAPHVAVETGSWDYYRGRAGGSFSHGDHSFAGWGHVEHDGGFRRRDGYDQTKLNLAWEHAGEADLGALFSGTRLRQDTAGFIFGEDAYKDSDARKSNPVAGAYRDADSYRLVGRYARNLGADLEFELRPYVRNSWMSFTQHFLPGRPEEDNRQNSAGFRAQLRHEGGTALVIGGLDLEYMDGWLEEFQAEPIEDGSDFLIETRPAGQHYDYDVEAVLVGPYVHWQQPLTDRFVAHLGLRYEYLRYDYDNRMLDGNTRDDGTPCGFGGCLFNRPSDRDDDFGEFAPKLGFVWAVGPAGHAYGQAARSFRFPQATELYRLQRQQSVADLDPERLDSLELGLRGRSGSWRWDVAAFYMEKDNFIFRDAEGFNVSDGETRHVGAEFLLDWRFAPRWSLAAAATWARHTYRFDRLAGGGEQIEKGNDVDTAPRRLSNLRLGWDFGPTGRAELEWVSLGDYYMNAANTARYDGHDLFNLRVQQGFGARWLATLRVTNLLDEDYAERADFAFGSFRYVPGRDRALFAELRYTAL